MIDLLEEALAVWRDCPATMPRFERSFTPADRAAREPLMLQFLDSVQAELRRPPRNREERQSVHQRLTAAFSGFGRTALGLEDRHLDLLLGGGLSAVGTTLARQARRFDPKVSVADILQATRNAWTACGLQML